MRDNKTFAFLGLVLLLLAGLWLAVGPEVLGSDGQNGGPVLVHSVQEPESSVELEIIHDDPVRAEGLAGDTWTYEFGSAYKN